MSNLSTSDSASRSVTVMIPSYNYGRFLRECVASVLQQADVDLDVVIVDNGSDDGSQEIAKDLAAQNAHVRFVEYSDNKGIVSSFNRCLDELRGDYALMLCADDCLTPGALSRAVTFMNQHPQVGMVYGPVVSFATLADVSQDQLDKRAKTPIIYAGNAWIEKRCRAGDNPIRAPEMVMRTATLKAAGRYIWQCPHTFDLNMWLRIAALADVAFLPGPPQALYRIHGSNHSSSQFGTWLPDIEQHWVAFDSFLEGHPNTSEAQHWRRIVSRTMARRARWGAIRSYAAGPASQRSGEVQALLDLAQTISGRDLSPLEKADWAIRRRMGNRSARFSPPFVARLIVRGVRRSLMGRRRVSTGL